MLLRGVPVEGVLAPSSRLIKRTHSAHQHPRTHATPPIVDIRSINDTDVMFEGEDKENQEFFDFDDVANI